MTHEERQLLLKDICARLPYGVKCRQFKLDSQVCTLSSDLLYKIENIEPYLRPMSSMTEEEEDEYQECGNKDIAEADIHLVPNNRMDWLNAHHFDYRGLIPMGLALEAPPGMYKTE